MKVAIITDTHFGKGNDSLVHDDYFAKFYDHVFFPELHKRKIKTVLHLGDLYDRRRFINFDILSRSRRYFVEPSKDFEWEMPLGNHDTYHSETLKLNGPDLLMNDHKSFYIYHQAVEVLVGNLLVLLVPWITKENSEQVMNAIANTKATVLMGHLDIHGFEMDKGQINKHGLDRSIFDRFKLVLSGHFHHKNFDGNIWYLGAPYEMTWADCDDPKGFYIFDTDTLDLEFVQNPFSLYKKFEYDDVNDEEGIYKLINDNANAFEGKFCKVLVKNRTNHGLFDTIHKLLNTAAHDLSVVDKVPDFAIKTEAVLAMAGTVDLSDAVHAEDTGRIIVNYCEAATYPAHIQPDRITTDMTDLYREASQMMAAT